MNSFFEFVRDFFGVILALLGTGGVSGWLLTRYKYNREKKQRKAHLKAKLLDEILRQCRVIERRLNKYENELGEYKRFIDFQELDPETGYPKNAFDFETLPNYSEYIGIAKSLREENKFIFDYLQDRKEEIEERFGQKLQWSIKEGQKSCYIKCAKKIDGSNRENWPEIIEWHITNMKKLEQALSEPLKEANEMLKRR